MPPQLIIMDKVVLLGVILKKEIINKSTSIMCINIIQNIKTVTPKPCIRTDEQND
jgi:hypothetical protein